MLADGDLAARLAPRRASTSVPATTGARLPADTSASGRVRGLPPRRRASSDALATGAQAPPLKESEDGEPEREAELRPLSSLA